MTAAIKTAIANDLKTWGYKGRVQLRKADRYAIEVMLNGKHFGLWSVDKATFVA